MQKERTGEDIAAERLFLRYLEGPETLTWCVEREGQRLGILTAKREAGEALLSGSLADPAAWPEALIALTDWLFGQGCSRLTWRLPLARTREREIAESLGWQGIGPDRDRDARGQLSHGLLRLSRETWFPLARTALFPEVEELPGAVLDLHCVCALAAKPEKHEPAVYCFEITEHGRWEAFGRIDLRLGYDADTLCSGNIGYGLQEAYRGHGYAAEACRMLRPLIVRHGMRRVVITSRPDNLPSRGTCRRLGATMVRRALLPEESTLYRNGEREICIYHWLPEENTKTAKKVLTP